MKYTNKLYKSYTLNHKWAKYVQELEEGKLLTFTFKTKGEQFYFNYIKRDISYELDFLEKDKYFDIITPFDYGGFYFTSDEILEKGLVEFEKLLIKENIVSGFFRFASLLNMNYKIIAKYINLLKIQDHILIDLRSDYKKEFSKRKNRNIKNAKKLAFKFIEKDSLDNFYSVYIDSMNRVNSNKYFKFNISILSDLLSFGQIFSIYFENKIVSSIFIIEDENEIYYFLGGTLKSYLKYGFNSLLFDLVCEYYKSSKKLFYLGGGKDGLYQFKKEFSNKVIPFYIGTKIFNKDIYDKLIIQTNRETNNFFPQYRKKII